MSIAALFRNAGLGIGLLLVTTVTSAAGCAAPLANPAPVAATAQAVELTLHETSATAAQTYADDLRRSGRYQTVELRMETPETARIRATTMSLSLRPTTTTRQ
jgi:hypothetical protein